MTNCVTCCFRYIQTKQIALLPQKANHFWLVGCINWQTQNKLASHSYSREEDRDDIDEKVTEFHVQRGHETSNYLHQ
jgi:hypothetical protein